MSDRDFSRQINIFKTIKGAGLQLLVLTKYKFINESQLKAGNNFKRSKVPPLPP